ncbi:MULTISPECIES: hypothetical protein [unclassified Lysobacter]
MNPLVELNLALILFVPWFSILAVLFWIYPRQPRTRARKLFDVTSLVIATGLAAYGMYWGFNDATAIHGGMWKQVVATMCAYTMFLLVMTVAVWLRHRWLRRIRLGGSRQPEPAPAQAAVREPTP